MAKVNLIPQAGVVVFTINNIDCGREGLMRFRIWRALQDDDLPLFGITNGWTLAKGYAPTLVPDFPQDDLINIPLDRINNDPAVDAGIYKVVSESIIKNIATDEPDFFDGNGINGIRDRIDIELPRRLLIRRPFESLKRERYFAEPSIDQFSLEFYNTKFPDDIMSCVRSVDGVVVDSEVAFQDLQQVDGQGLFEKYIKPERYFPPNSGRYKGVVAQFVPTITPFGTNVSGTLNLVPVHVAWEFMMPTQTDYRHVRTGVMQDAYKGTDKRWDVGDPRSKSSVIPQLWETKEFNPERIYTFNCSASALIGIGAVPPRPSVDPNDQSSYYMPFHNPLLADGVTPNPITALPWDQVGPYGSTVPADQVLAEQGVADYTYEDGTVDPVSGDPTPILRRAMWRRHIPIRKWLKSVFDFGLGVDAYDFYCDDSDILVRAGQLSACEPGQPASIIQLDNPKKVNFGFDAPPSKWMLLPECLFGLYDLIPAPANVNDIVPVPPVHWGNQYESVWQCIQEVCFMVGLVATDEVNRDVTPPRHIIRFSARSKHRPNKFATLIPMKEPSIEIFPEGESGISVQNRKTFANPYEKDGDFQDLFAYKPSADFPGTVYLKNPEPNPAVFPATAQKPNTGLVLSLCAGGDSCAVDTRILGVQGIVLWLSTGRPAVGNNLIDIFSGNPIANGQEICDRSENYPMFAPLVSADRVQDNWRFDPEWQQSDGDPNLDADKIGICFAPVVVATPDITISPGQLSSFKMADAVLYNKFFVNPIKKYTAKYKTITQFTDVTPGSKTFGQQSWEFVAIDFLNDFFQDEYWVHSLTRDWEAMETGTENWLDRHLPQPVLPPPNPPRQPPPPPVITPPVGSEPLCGKKTIIFGVSYSDLVCGAYATLDGAPMPKANVSINQQGDLIVAVNVDFDWCIAPLGPHTICVTVIPCDTRVAPVTTCWNFTVNHNCCGTTGGGGGIGNPIGTSSSSPTMMGLAKTVTVQGSGNISVSMSLKLANSSTGGAGIVLYIGTGTPPANGASVPGGAVALTANSMAMGRGEDNMPLIGFAAGLTLGATYWIDIALASVGSGTVSASNISHVIQEV